MESLDKQAFRKALGAFPTGVTIVTTSDTSNGKEPVGVTASSFNSVSLDPPLVLWSLAKNSLSHDAFCASGHFAIHVLAETQEDLSNRFAKSGDDKFDGIGWEAGLLGSPVLEDYAAVFECKTRHIYEGGDHTILVGEVMAHEAHDHAPLVYHGGGYTRRASEKDIGTAPSLPPEGAQMADLLAKAYARTIAGPDHGFDDTALSAHFSPSELRAGKGFLQRIADLPSD